MKNILFRADSSSTIGTGHIMRDLVLASQYKDSNIIFATQDLDGNINKKIKEAGYKVELLKSNSLKEVTELVNKYNIEMIVIDHYGIDYKYEKKLKKKTGVKILSFDDTYEKHFCDILLNHNISANEKRYKGLVPKNCELRCGSKYTLLRDEFIEQKTKKTIFLSMGGADNSNLNIKVLNVLSQFHNIEVNLITTTANQNLKKLKEFAKRNRWVDLYINSTEIAKLMKKSDFVIVPPSVTLNEVYFMEIPFIAIQTADNQQDMSRYLIEHKYFILKKFNKNKLLKVLNFFLKENQNV